MTCISRPLIDMHPPPLDSPFGAGSWKQPRREDVLIDDDHALLTVEDFNALPEYSCSIPTGAFPGKMWRRHDGAHDMSARARGHTPVWMLCWYGYTSDPKQLSINRRRVLLV